MKKLRVAVVHNSYQHRGGEDSVVDSEIELLRSKGNEVITYFRNNDDVADMSVISTAVQTLWSSRTTADISNLVFDFRPDVIHVHNTLPLISPSLYWAAKRAKVPVVQTLHNFRLMCLNALYLRDGKVCEDCVGHLPWRGVIRKCYRGSAVASVGLSGMISLHRSLGTYKNKVTRYIALNNFCRSKFIDGGLPANRILVKPNFVDAPNVRDLKRYGLLFVGRLSIEKGIDTLAKAALLKPAVDLRVVGDGPLSNLFDSTPNVLRLGALPQNSVRTEMDSAVALVLPSICYENFPRTIVEAFGAGLPVIASRIGALAELVTDGKTGLLFEPNNPQDFADKMEWALAHPDLMAEMGKNARLCYEEKYTADINYKQLISIYENAIEELL